MQKGSAAMEMDNIVPSSRLTVYSLRQQSGLRVGSTSSGPGGVDVFRAG